MPNLDGTGPRGEGPGTGLGRGPCVLGRRAGIGARRGFGGRRRFARVQSFCPFVGDQMIDEGDKQSLSAYEKELQKELQEVQSLLKKK